MEMKKVSELFGVNAPDTAVVSVRDRLSDLPAEAYPAIDPDYVFDSDLLRKMLRILLGQSARRNVLLTGEPGVGKSSVLLQMAARLNIPVFSLACSGRTRFDHMIGSHALLKGETVWKDGPLLLAMKYGGVFLANEITRMDPGEQMDMAEVLDSSGTLTNPHTGEVVRAQSGFVCVATGNTGGYGDTEGAYPGERASSPAFLDRFQKLEVTHLPKEQELALLRRVAPNVPETIAAYMVGLAQEVRENFVGRGGSLRLILSTRSLLVWAKETAGYTDMRIGKEPIMAALEDTILNGAPKDELQAVKEIWDQWISGSKSNPAA